jgi:hypothetical protein
VGNEVGAEVPLVVEAAVPLPTGGKVVSILQDDSGCDAEGSDGEGRSNDDLSSDDGEGSDNDDSQGSNNGDGEDSGSDDGEDKAVHIPFRMTLAGIVWFKCLICIREEYDSKAKVVLHAIEVISQDVGSPNVVKHHRQVLRARRR